MQKVINLFGGPGTGKSTTASGLFYVLKRMGINCELISEYAKDKTWEENAATLKCQEYIFGKQQYRMHRVSGKVEFIVTDAPLLLSTLYIPEDYPLPSLKQTVREAYQSYDNFNVFLVRKKEYQSAGRRQTEEEARELDEDTRKMLDAFEVPYHVVDADESAVLTILRLLFPGREVPVFMV